MVLIFGIAGVVAAAYALWSRIRTTSPVYAGELAERIHVQTNALVRVAALAHAVISLFAGMQPARLPAIGGGYSGQRWTRKASELREEDDDE